MRRRVTCLLLLAATAANCRPLTGGAGDLVADADWAWQYLEEFGYINEASTKFVSSKRKVLANAIADFQSFSGLNVTCGWTSLLRHQTPFISISYLQGISMTRPCR